MIANAIEFLVTFLPGQERRLTRTGVQIHSLQYWHPALETWVGQGATVLVYYDPRDVSLAYVRTPGGIVVKASITTPEVGAISLVEWNIRRRYERSLAQSPERVAEADASLKRSDALVAHAKTKRQVRRREATAAAGDRYRSESPVAASPPSADQASQKADATMNELATEGRVLIEAVLRKAPKILKIEGYEHDF